MEFWCLTSRPRAFPSAETVVRWKHPAQTKRLSNMDLGPCRTCLLLRLCDLGNSLSLNASASAVQRGWAHSQKRLKDHSDMPYAKTKLAPGPTSVSLLFKSKIHCLGICLTLLPVVSITRKITNFLSFPNITLFYDTEVLFQTRYSFTEILAHSLLHPTPGRTVISYPFSNSRYHFFLWIQLSLCK